MKLKILLPIFVFLLAIPLVSAYTVNITWNLNQNDFDFEVFKCADSSCSSVSSLVTSGNSGSSQSVNTVFTASGNVNHAVYFYKEDFRALGFIVNTINDFTTTFNSNFVKKDNCKADILLIGLSNNNPSPGQSVTVDVQVKSPFSAAASAPGSPRFRNLPLREDFFSADVDVRLKLMDNNGIERFDSTRSLSLLEDELEIASFTLANLQQGTFTIDAKTDVTDDQCNQNNKIKQKSSKTLSVVPGGLTDLPNPVISAPAQAFLNQPVTFDASSSTDDEGIVSFVWDFGDGFTATGPIVTHTYTSTGNFVVTLTVTDTDGNVISTTRIIQVTEEFTRDNVGDAGGTSRRHKVSVEDVSLDKRQYQCGEEGNLQLFIRNTGTFDENNLQILLSSDLNMDFGRVEEFDLDRNDLEIVNRNFVIPRNSGNGNYRIDAEVIVDGRRDLSSADFEVVCGTLNNLGSSLRTNLLNENLNTEADNSNLNYNNDISSSNSIAYSVVALALGIILVILVGFYLMRMI